MREGLDASVVRGVALVAIIYWHKRAVKVEKAFAQPQVRGLQVGR